MKTGRGREEEAELEKEKKPEDAESRCQRGRVGPRTNTSLILPAFVCHNLGQRPMIYGCFILCRCSEGQKSGSCEWGPLGVALLLILLLPLQGVSRDASVESRCKQGEKQTEKKSKKDAHPQADNTKRAP